MKVNPNSILPSQDFLKPDTIRFIAKCIHDNKLEGLPSTPIVRADSAGKLIAIDGHNLIAYMSYLQKPIDVHIAKSPYDGLPGSTEADKTRNTDLLKKYHTVLTQQHQVETLGIKSFTDLIAKYPVFFEE